ncbi:hypothetical protein MTR_3g073490 [Medicago truncatula]|uniref:Uncharacterized protein n=1 Tax=Medicago truncatula TaxID=3880 RepID=G7J469_MEDTR|nr:hypothetical protein MTR_3g073490 [Medicago truncatula]
MIVQYYECSWVFGEWDILEVCWSSKISFGKVNIELVIGKDYMGTPQNKGSLHIR